MNITRNSSTLYIKFNCMTLIRVKFRLLEISMASKSEKYISKDYGQVEEMYRESYKFNGIAIDTRPFFSSFPLKTGAI